MPATSGKEVTLTISAKDNASAEISKIEKAIRGINKVDNQKGVLKLTQDLRKEAKQLETEFEQVNQRIRQLISQRYPRDSGPVQQEIARARELKTEIQQRTNAIGRLRILSRDASSENVRNLTAQKNAAVAAVTPLVTGTQEAVREQKALSNAVEQTTTQLRRQTAAARNTGGGTLARIRESQGGLIDREVSTIQTRQGRGFLGLRPYELQNLSYQINDVVTGLASGQRPMQVFSQQIGQIAQILPGVVLNLAKFAATFGAPFLAILPGIVRIQTFNNHLEEFNKTLALNADAARYSVPELAKFAQQLDDAGLSAKDARESINSLINAGIDRDRFDGLIETAQSLSKALGKDMSEAMQLTLKSFDNGIDGVRELDRQLNFLTAQQYSNIQAMVEHGSEAEAVAEAQRILQDRMDEFARKSQGSWGRAFETLGEAWQSFTELLASSRLTAFVIKEIDQFGKDIGQIAEEIKTAIALVEDATSNSTAELEQQLEELRRQRREVEGLDTPYGRLSRQDLDERIIDTEREIRNIRAADAREKEADEAERIAEEAEREKKARQDIGILAAERANELLEEGDLTEQASKERFLQIETEKLINEAKERGVELTAEQLKNERELLGLAYERREASSFYKELSGVSDGIEASIRLLEKFEGFQQTAKHDVNAQRLGFGSDTITDASGNVRRVRAGDSVTREQAYLDLERRIKTEFLPAVVNAVGEGVFSALSPQQQGALVSLGYNYGAGAWDDDLAAVAAAVRSGDSSAVAAAISSLQGHNDGINRNRRLQEASFFSDAASESYEGQQVDEFLKKREEAAKAAERQAEAEKQANTAVADQIQQMQFELSLQDQTARQQAIQNALRDAELTKKKAGLELTEQERAEIEHLAAAQYDRENAEKIATEELNRLLERRSLLLQQAQTAQAEGEDSTFQNLRTEIQSLDGELQEAANKAIAFWQSIGGAAADNAILKIKATLQNLEQLEAKVLDAAQLNEQLADTGVDAMQSFAQATAEGENAADAFWTAMRTGIANFILEITAAIAKQLLLNALTGGGGSGGGVGGFIASIGNTIAGVNHEGGVAGGSGTRRTVSAAAFMNAVRYHTGGIGGLKPNEVPSILKKGEEVLTEDDPRHINNGGGGSNVNIKQVNVIDPAEIQAQALQDEEGQRVLFNFFSRNAQKINQSLNR